MFYVKAQICEGTQVTTRITGDNVFTRCLECDVELQVDLEELAADEHFDLVGTGIYCSKCSYKHWKGAVRHGNQQV